MPLDLVHRVPAGGWVGPARSGRDVCLLRCSPGPVASLAVYDAEHLAPDADITTFGGALWWACVTITSVGYGDLSLVTFEGRFIAVAMMICAIALPGRMTATIASWLVERVSAREEAIQTATQAQVEELSDQVRQLHALLVQSVEPHNTAPPAPGDRPASR